MCALRYLTFLSVLINIPICPTVQVSILLMKHCEDIRPYPKHTNVLYPPHHFPPFL